MHPYLKMFAGWVTDLKLKYWDDPFVRSKVNIILLQILFVIFLILIVGLYFTHLYQSISETIINGIMDSLKHGLKITGEDIIVSTQLVRDNYFLGFLFVTIMATFGFGYIVTRISMAPAKNALESHKRFISNIAHELRTPISVMKTDIEVALMDKSMKGDTRQILTSNMEELERISEIINNLLSFSNLMKSHKMTFRNVDVGSVAEEAIEKLKGSISKKKLEITFRKIHPITVFGNKTAIEQVVLNLLKNSLNYTGSGGYIYVTVEPDYKGFISITVKDNGIGISKEDLKHIFEPFFRAEKSRKRLLGSSGLGLTIVSELVKMHSGKISIKSVLGLGTTVIISLPYREAHNVDKTEENETGSTDEIYIDFSN